MSKAAILRLQCLTLVCVSAAIVSLPTVAAEESDMEEVIVIVTAQRTDQNIQNVPISVTALSGELMEDKGMLTPSDLQMSSPSVNFTATNFGASSFSIRGVGRLVIGGEPGVSTHVNEIAVDTNLNSVEFYDMERVEILRGPQGTLFGRNATGGAINSITNRPDFDELDGFLDVEAGDYSNVRFKGALNVPLGDRFAVRVAGMNLERDGYIDNLAAGQVGTDGSRLTGIDDEVDGRDITTFRITGEWQITDNANLWLMYYDFDEDDDRARITNQVCVTNTLPTTGCLPDEFGFEPVHLLSTTNGLILWSGGALPLADSAPSKFARPAMGFRKMHTDFQPVFEDEEQLWAFGFNYEFSQFSFGLNGAYQEREYLSRQDYLMNVGETLFDGTIDLPVSSPAGRAGDEWSGPCNYRAGTSGVPGGCTLPIDGTASFVYDQSDQVSEYWTVEATVASSLDGRFNFVLGTNVYRGEWFGDYYVLGNGLDAAGAYPGFFNNNDDPSQPSRADGWAAFGEVYFEVTDALKFTLGLRYNEDEREDFGTSAFLNSFDLNGPAALAGALGATTFVRADLADFIFGAPLGDQTGLANLYGVSAAMITAAEATAPASAERIGIATTIPSIPLAAETRSLTGSPTSFNFDNVSSRIGFDWHLNENSMVYVFYSSGYKPGGLNPAIPVDFQSTSKFSFDEEDINAWEIGSKNVLFDNSLVLNGAFFLYDYTGLQVTRIVNNSSINENIDSDIMGLELDLLWRPFAVPNLQIDASYTWIDTEVQGSASIDPVNRTASNPDWVLFNNLGPGALTGTNFVARRAEVTPAVIAGCAGLGATIPVPNVSYADGLPALWSRACLDAFGVTTSDGLQTSLDGNELPNTPDTAFQLGASYTWDIPAIAGSLTLRWDYFWQGDSWAREFNTKGDEIDSWSQHNAQLIYESADGHWTSRAFVRNLLDDDNITGKYLTSDTSGFFRNYFLTEPRIFGLSVRYNLSGG